MSSNRPLWTPPVMLAMLASDAVGAVLMVTVSLWWGAGIIMFGAVVSTVVLLRRHLRLAAQRPGPQR